MSIFIAEIGINHGGDMKLAEDMIVAAKASGADIVKFQMYDPLKILGPKSPHLEEAARCQFSKNNHRLLKEFCNEVGIEYCCSVFDPIDVLFFEEIGMKRYKIASRSVNDIELIKAIKATNKPAIASNGLDKDLTQLKSIFGRRADLSILECISEYPTSITKMANNFFELPKNIRGSSKWGLSSHCPSIIPSLMAIMYGASIIEHHVRFDWQKDGCDMSSSITFEQFKQMVDIARENASA